MKRIMVIGCCGAGKSTFSKKLQQIIDIQLIHLDQCYWQPNWQETDKLEWQEAVQKLANQPEWIIDGNYGGTLDIRLDRADTIIFLDYPSWKCLWRVMKRVLKYWGKVRPDMPEGCKERFDWNFLHYVATFNQKKRPGIFKKISALNQKKNIFIFKTDKQANKFLNSLTSL